jgi:hypothetical protein
MSGVNITPNVNTLQPASVNVTSATTATLVAAVAGAIVRVYRIFIMPSAAQNLTFQDTSAGALQIPVITYTATTNSAPTVMDFTGEPWLFTPVGRGLQLVSTTTAPTAVAIWFNQASS